MLKLAGGDNRLPAGTALTVSGGTLDLGAATQTVSGVTLNSGAIVNGTLAGSGGVTKTTTGTGTLSGANTYTGVTTVGAGTLVIANNTALGGTAAGTTVSGYLNLQGGITVADESLTINANGSGTSQLRGLAGDNTWAGPITLNATNILRVGVDAGQSLTLSGPITLTGSHATGVVLEGDGTGLISGVISGTNPGSTLYRSSGGNAVWTLTGENTYVGQTKVTGTKALYVGNGGTTGRLGIGDVFVSGTLVFNRSNSLEVPNLIANSGATNGNVTQAGTGTLITRIRARPPSTPAR